MADRKSKKINYMFKLPSTFMTDDVKKTQSEAIHAFVQMRYSAISKCNKDTLENDIKTFVDGEREGLFNTNVSKECGKCNFRAVCRRRFNIQ